MTNQTVIDPRVLAGMKTQLATRATKLSAGGKRLGWKAGFGAPAALEKFKLPGPLVGFMLAEARVETGSTVSMAGWAKPVVEPEIAVYMGTDLTAGGDRARVIAAIAGIGPAIELADLNPPPEDVAAILAGNIFHRHVILGSATHMRAGAGLEGVVAQVTRNGQAGPTITGDALEANTGRILDVVGHIATTLSACGEKLSRGDVIICGSVVPPIFAERGDNEIRFALQAIGEVSVRLAW